MKKKKEQAEKKPELKPGDHVTYDGEEWELVEMFGGGKYSVIFGTAGRFSVKTSALVKAEE